MSDTTTQNTPRRRFFKSAAIATLLAAVASGIGIRAFADAGGFGGWRRTAFMGGPIDPARMDEHLDRMLKHLYVEIDASEAQQQQLDPIVKDAARDLFPLCARLHDGRRQVIELLSQPTVDRSRLEALRADQLALMEQCSKRLTQAVGDIADVLTPEQRQSLAERIARWHGPRG